MPPVPPRADADPSVRHLVSIQVPGAVRAQRETTSLTLVSEGVVATNMSVGSNMITGLICDPKVYRKGEMVQLGGWSVQDGFLAGGYKQVYRREIDGIPKPGEHYVAEVTFTFFETDLPAQHFWQPQAGKFYRVLWSQTFRAEIQ
jgi:hypothetical protein